MKTKESVCPECNSVDVKIAIHTDYKECNECFHFWETKEKPVILLINKN